MPKISVIVPVYKVEQYLDRCVESILAQTFTDFELILIDDGSPDNCPAMCDEWAKKDDRIVVIHQENGGLSAARNAGIDWAFSNSDSEWITFIDSDDWVHQTYLAVLLDAAQKYHVKLSQCGSQSFFHENDVKVDGIPTISKLVHPEEIYVENGAIASVRKLIHRTLWGDLRFPIGKIHEDEYVMYKIIFGVENIAIIENAPFYYYRLREGSIMHSSFSENRLDIIDAYELQLEFFRTINNAEMYKLTAKRFIQNLTRQYFECKKSNVRYKISILMKIRRKLLYLFLKHRKLLNLNISNNPDICNATFPISMYFYWSSRALITKIRK